MSSSQLQKHVPWLEKHRPKVLEDVTGNNEAIACFKVFSIQGNIPNFLLAGSPGCGKTTSILCLISKLLGPAAKSATLELNASDERGIDVIRERITLFAQQKVTLPAGRHKFVILDEADSMTEGAQQALRRIMELYSDTTRFALACNDSTKIIEPIQSRCAVVRFGSLGQQDILKSLLKIIDKENVKYTDDGLKAIIDSCQGDMRQAINSLQAVTAAFEVASEENVYKISDEPHPKMIAQMIQKCIAGDYFAAYDILTRVLNMGYMQKDLIGSISRAIQQMEQPEHVVLESLKLTAQTQLRIAKGSNSKLQLCRLLAMIYELCQGNGQSGADL